MSEEAGDGSEDFEDIDDAGNLEFLFVEAVGVDGDITENVWSAALAQYLDGADGVEHNSIDLSILDVLDGTLAQGDNVAVVDARLHRVACDVAPGSCFLETGHDDVAGRYCCLVVEDLTEASDEIYVKIWCSLPYFH